MRPQDRMTIRADWDALAEDIAELVATDDPRLASAVATVESWVGCALAGEDRSPAVLGRRFARAHRLAIAEGLAPMPGEVLPAV